MISPVYFWSSAAIVLGLNFSACSWTMAAFFSWTWVSGSRGGQGASAVRFLAAGLGSALNSAAGGIVTGAVTVFAVSVFGDSTGGAAGGTRAAGVLGA